MTEIKEIDDTVREEIPERIPETCKKKRRTVPVLKPRDGLKIAFFVPVLVMICIFAQRGIFPFGERCFLRTDMYHQYAPFFSEFQYKLRTGGSLLYSWDVGMGVNFAALYAYYLASPLNWLILLCPKKLIIEFMTIMIVIKIGLSGLSFAWYLKQHSKNCILGVGFFGIFYALSGYMAAYSWNIMWLDCILLFPLIVYGLERLVREQKGMLYCVTLGLSILSNYYISIMTCLFLVLYFIALLILEEPGPVRKYVESCVRFGIYSLLSGGLAAGVLLPEICALQSTASGNLDFPKAWTSYFPIFDMIAEKNNNWGELQTANASYYSLLSSDELDTLVTSLELNHNLQPDSLTIGEPVTQSLTYYTASENAGQSAAPSAAASAFAGDDDSDNDSITADTADTTAQGNAILQQILASDLIPDYDQPGYYRSVAISFCCTGEDSDFLSMLDDMAANYPSVQLVSFSIDTRSFADTDGSAVTATAFNVSLNVILCDKGGVQP